LQAVAQQTPSAQFPDTQSAAAEHVCPVFFLQAPVALQLLTPMQLSGSSAFLMATQVPPEVQAWQAPHDGEPQQNPSTQALLVHSALPPAPHAIPFAFLGTHIPPLQ
jgi:hypothetical protein